MQNSFDFFSWIPSGLTTFQYIIYFFGFIVFWLFIIASIVLLIVYFLDFYFSVREHEEEIKKLNNEIKSLKKKVGKK